MGLPIDKAAVFALTSRMRGLVHYGWGHKIAFDVPVDEFLKIGSQNGSDCSNWVRWVVFQASKGKIQLPDGSMNIGDYFASLAKSGKVVKVPVNHSQRKDGTLYCCGFDLGNNDRHVWLSLDGMSSECHGKNSVGDGVDKRPVTCKALSKIQWCYAIAGGDPTPSVASVTKMGSEIRGTLKGFDTKGMNLFAPIPLGVLTTSSGDHFIAVEALKILFKGISVTYEAPNVIIRKLS